MNKRNTSPKQLLHCLIVVDSALEIVEDSFELTSDAIFALMNQHVEAYVTKIWNTKSPPKMLPFACSFVATPFRAEHTAPSKSFR